MMLDAFLCKVYMCVLVRLNWQACTERCRYYHKCLCITPCTTYKKGKCMKVMLKSISKWQSLRTVVWFTFFFEKDFLSTEKHELYLLLSYTCLAMQSKIEIEHFFYAKFIYKNLFLH